MRRALSSAAVTGSVSESCCTQAPEPGRGSKESYKAQYRPTLSVLLPAPHLASHSATLRGRDWGRV